MREDGDRLRRARNCDGNTPESELELLYFPWAPKLKRCPHAAISQSALAYLEAWRDWRAFGVLPEAGDLGDQPGHIYQGLRACELVRMHHERSEIDRADRVAEEAGDKAGEQR